MKPLILLPLLAVLYLAGSGCYYDKMSELYPPATSCDTAAVKWSTTIKPIITTECAYEGCHAGSSPSIGIDLSKLQQVQEQALNGALLGTIEHQSGYDPMPKGRSDKLPDCDISKIRLWVAQGAPDN